jgi:DNA-directed RNA polymerase specialized sigma24 family protein
MSSDFSVLQSRDIRGLRLLALLLTADETKAEKCFVSGLQGGENENPIFKDWAHSWARRAIIANASHLRSPGLALEDSASMALDVKIYATPEQARKAKKVLALSDFERLVLVISFVEGYPDQECALLLHRSLHDIREACSRALHQTAEGEGPDAGPENENTLHLHRHSLQMVVT